MKEISGTVEWIDLSGGFFGIVGDDGKKYFPVDGLPAQARTQGIHIRAKAQSVNSINIYMWGNTVKLTDISIQ